MQSRSLDHVKDFVSRLVHLSLSLRMSGHMKRFRACMRTVVESKLTLLQGACSAEAADYRSYILELFLARGHFAAKRRSLLWVWCNGDWRNQNAIEHIRQSSWTLRPDAVIHFSASGKCVLGSPRVKATVRVPSPSVDGLRPRLRRGRLVALRPQCLARQLSWPSLCRVVSSAPGLFVPASGPSAAAALPDCQALQRQQGRG